MSQKPWHVSSQNIRVLLSYVGLTDSGLETSGLSCGVADKMHIAASSAVNLGKLRQPYHNMMPLIFL